MSSIKCRQERLSHSEKPYLAIIPLSFYCLILAVATIDDSVSSGTIHFLHIYRY